MGFAIAHPLTLLLFKDAIAAEIDKTRDAEIEAVRESFVENKANLQARITAANASYQEFDQQRQAALNAPFEDETADDQPQAGTVSTAKQAMEEQLEQATSGKRTQIEDLDAQLLIQTAALTEARQKVTEAQNLYDAEISGQRGGPAGIGPRARSIEADVLAPARQDSERLTALVTSLTQQRTQLSSEVLAAEEEIRQRYAESAAAEAEAIREDEMKIATLQRNLRSQRLAIFQKQQEDLADQYKAQMESAKQERDRLMSEDEQLANLQEERIEKIAKGTRQDLLTQTLVLHHLFKKGDEGGHFAMIVYGMIAGLFMLIDTIPLVVKFFTKSSVYDRMVRDEEKTHGMSPWERDQHHRQQIGEMLLKDKTDWSAIAERSMLTNDDILRAKQHNENMCRMVTAEREAMRWMMGEFNSPNQQPHPDPATALETSEQPQIPPQEEELGARHAENLSAPGEAQHPSNGELPT